LAFQSIIANTHKPIEPLSPADQDVLTSLLEELDGTKNPIKKAKDWTLAHWNQAAAVAAAMRSALENYSVFAKKLNILYLINDILYHASMRRTSPGALDQLSEAFKLPIVFMMWNTYQSGSQQDQQAKVLQLLELWKSRGTYEEGTVSRMVGVVTDSKTPKEAPHTLNPNPPPSFPPQPSFSSTPNLPFFQVLF